MKNNPQKSRFEDVFNENKGRTKIRLYDLIEAVSDEVAPGEDNLIPETVQHLFDSGQARFTDCTTEICGGA